MAAAGVDYGTKGSVKVPISRSKVLRSAFAIRAKDIRPFVAGFVVGLIGLALSAVSWVVIATWEDRLAKLDFEKIAEDHGKSLQSGLDQYLQELIALRALFNASNGQVSRAEFDVFTSDLLAGQTAILSFSWVPRVGREERDALERAAIGDGIQDYEIKAIGADGGLSRAAEQDEYFPIYYTNVLSLRERVYGIDLHDGGVRQQPLDRARDSNRSAATGNFHMQAGTGNRNGFFVVLPVYRRGLPHDTVEDRRRNLLGFVQGAFQFEIIIDAIMASAKSPLNILVYETLARLDDLPVHVRANNPEQARLTPKSQAITAELNWTGRLNAGDRGWHLVVVPASVPSHLMRHHRAWIVFGAGLLITGLIVSYMWNTSRLVSRLRAAKETATALARTDALTALSNRRAFVERLNQVHAGIGRGNRPYAVLFIDLDDFKDINDTQGHVIGDALLVAVAARLVSAVRASDLVARFGGDEFAVLQTDVNDASGAGELAGKLNKMIAAPYRINGIELHLTASIGIALFSDLVERPETLLMQADLALYRAKDEGRNIFRFHSAELDTQVHLRVNLTEELWTGIERGELELHYQPQVAIETGQILGLEALARWNHPKRGLIMPSIFIPIAEKSAVIRRLGSWVFDTACAQFAAWQEEGIAPQVLALNVSGKQIRWIDDFDRDITASLARWNVDPGKLEIELTETELMDASQRHSDALKRLRQKGLRIAIDDFGTGYSSLEYLTIYPVNRLKIAQQLVFRVTEDPRHATVVRAAIWLAHELGIEVIAEGVETDTQAHFLLAAGCDTAQGFRYSRAVPAVVATALLREGKIGVERFPPDLAIGLHPLA